MRRFSVVVVAIAAALILQAAVPALVAQGARGAGRGGRMGRGAGGGAGAGPTAQEQMDAALKEAGLNDSERAATERAMRAKMAARQELITAFEQLRRTSADEKATDEQLRQATDAYGQALSKYRSTVQTEDQSLVKQLSVKSHARCLALGVLDNGLGMGAMRGGGGMRGGGRRGGGGRGGRGGRGMGGGGRGMGGPPA